MLIHGKQEYSLKSYIVSVVYLYKLYNYSLLYYKEYKLCKFLQKGIDK